MALKIAFMGTPEFAVPSLQALLRSKHEIRAVFTQPDRPSGRGLEQGFSPVKREALAAGVEVIQPEKLSEPFALQKLQELQPDLIIVVAYGQILKQTVLDLPRLGCVNVHASLLPRWRGASPIASSILAGDPETGVTIMSMAAGLDSGPILLQEKTPLAERETADSLHDRLAALGAGLLAHAVDLLEEGQLPAVPQQEALVTHCSKLSRDHQWLSPHEESAAALDRKVRAYDPWPGTSVRVLTPGADGAPKPLRLKIKRARPRANISATPGELFERFGMLLLGTPQGSLQLEKIQWEGKKEVDPMEFLNGLRGMGWVLPLTTQ